MKTKLGLLYGGKSAEHQVSLRTALAVIQALDHQKFDIHPIYISEEGEWFKGPQLDGPVDDIKGIEIFRSGRIGSSNSIRIPFSDK